jgi:AcrR family transcriptional regulator
MSETTLRVYGGVAGDHRQVERRAQLIEAGLELLAGDSAEPMLTVRGVCRQASLAARYFYESFADRDDLARAIFDHVVEAVAASAVAAVSRAPADPRSQIRAGLAGVVDSIAADPRRGRLLFSPALSSPAVGQRRIESTRTFVHLLGLHAQATYGIPGDLRLELAAEFLVGGFAQALTSWLNGTLAVSPEELVDHCTDLFLAVAGPR